MTAKALTVRTGAGQQVDAAVTRNEDLLFSLWERWQDEAGYEEIGEYARAMDSAFGAGVKVERAIAHPFGAVVRCKGRRFRVVVTARDIRWHSIPA